MDIEWCDVILTLMQVSMSKNIPVSGQRYLLLHSRDKDFILILKFIRVRRICSTIKWQTFPFFFFCACYSSFLANYFSLICVLHSQIIKALLRPFLVMPWASAAFWCLVILHSADQGVLVLGRRRLPAGHIT